MQSLKYLSYNFINYCFQYILLLGNENLKASFLFLVFTEQEKEMGQ